MVDAGVQDKRIKALSIVAGHYLTRDTANMYLGGEKNVQKRVEAARVAKNLFEKHGTVEYIPIVSNVDKNALLLPKPIYEWYIRWTHRGTFWNFHGLWENRITRMSEAEIWTHKIENTLARLNTPTMMIHADHAASGPEVPRRMFGLIPTQDKKLVWLGKQVQFQFYEDPITIDGAVDHITSWFKSH